MTDDNDNTRCGKCGYTWEYSGSMQVATCPNCSFKTVAHNSEETEA